MATFDFSQVAADLMAHSRDNKTHLMSKLMLPGIDGGLGGEIKPISYYMGSIATKDEVVLTELFIQDVLQPGGKDTFNPKSNIAKFKTRIGKVRPIKIDALFSHTEILQAYKNYLSDAETDKIDPEKIPFEDHIMGKILARANENKRNKSLMNGVYNPADLTPFGCFDGLKKVFLDAIADGSIPAGNVIDINPITKLNAVDEFEKIADALPDEYFYEDLVCICPRATKRAYERNYQTRFDSLPYNTKLDKPMIEGTNIEFVIEPGLTGFARPIITPKSNIYYLYDNRGEITNLDVDYDKRTRSIAIVADAQAGLQIACAELVWTGDAA